MNLLCDTAIFQLNWQQYNSYPSLSSLNFVSTLLSVEHFPTLMHINPSTKWQSKTVSDDHIMAIENCQYKTLSLSKRLTILCFVIERWLGKS